MSVASKIFSILLPKGKSTAGGNSLTNTFNTKDSSKIFSALPYDTHKKDIYDTRLASNSQDILEGLFVSDPDVSATVHAYLTVAATTPRFYVYDAKGQLDQKGMELFANLLAVLTKRLDYTTGFKINKSLSEICQDLRYLLLLRGSVGAELIFDKFLQLNTIRTVDTNYLTWTETTPGNYIPTQFSKLDKQITRDLNSATFFFKGYHQTPTDIRSYSLFTSAINTIASRQQVMNDLYTIMNKNGHPRILVNVLEEVIRNSLPQDIKANPELVKTRIQDEIGRIAASISALKSGDAIVHTNTTEFSILNEKGASSSLDATAIISVLNSANQAGLKVVSTVIGRGESGVNTASVEARIFALSADSLNIPVADILSDIFSLALQMTGYQGYVTCKFDSAELRPKTELEPQMIMLQARSLESLSLGLITDDEYCMTMFGRPSLSSAPKLQGTEFKNKVNQVAVDSTKISPNSDPLGRSVSKTGG